MADSDLSELSEALENQPFFRERTHSGGYRPSLFDTIIKNPVFVELYKKYEASEIKSVKKLQIELNNQGLPIGVTTLTKFLTQIKEAAVDTKQVFVDLRIEKAISKYDNEVLLLVGTDNEQNWRRFRKTNESDATEYFTCISCEGLKNPNPEKIARIIVRSGILEQRVFEHESRCLGSSYGILKAEFLDRTMRKMAAGSSCGDKSKELWRKGLEEAMTEDAENDLIIEDADSVAHSYPDWNAVRSSYAKRKQKTNICFDDPYNLPPALKVTKMGSIRLALGKDVNESHRWLLKSESDLGIISFCSEAQVEIARKCHIFLMDATFSVSPAGFYQLFTVHGFFSRERNDNGEFVVLAWCLMEKRKTENYVAFLNALKEKWNLNLGSNSIRIHSDYERAEMSAIQEVFGQNVVYGCLFHYVKAALMYLRKETPLLFKLYLKEKPEHGPFWKIIRKILALPLLPKKSVMNFWDVLKICPFEIDQTMENDWNHFVNYIENEWLRKSGNLWNFNQIGRVRGINPAESYHSTLKKDPQSMIHGSVQNFIPWLQTMGMEVDARIVKLMGGAAYKPRNKIYEKVDRRIKETLDNYENWLSNGGASLTRNELIYSTHYVLSVLSYQLADVNEVGIPLREARKRQRLEKELPVAIKKKKQTDASSEKDEVIVIKVEGLFPSPLKPRPDFNLNSVYGIDRLTEKRKKQWSCILIGVDFHSCKTFIMRTVEKSKGRILAPIRVTTFQISGLNCTPASNAGEAEKWCSNFDLVAASIFFDLNIVLCTKVRDIYNWEIYRPGRRVETLLSGNQDKGKPTAYILLFGGHFEVILDVK